MSASSLQRFLRPSASERFRSERMNAKHIINRVNVYTAPLTEFHSHVLCVLLQRTLIASARTKNPVFLTHMLLHSFSRQIQSELDHLDEASEDDEGGTARSRSLRSRRLSLSQKVCCCCGDGFSLLFNRRVECSGCGLGSCRRCSDWIPEKQVFNCKACRGER